MSMFCPLKLSSTDGKNIVWEQKNPNAPLTHRPLSLQMGKESVDNLQSMCIFNEPIRSLKEDGFSVVKGDLEIQVYTDIDGHMMDRKTANLYTGLGGSYCDLCHVAKHDGGRREIGEQAFAITRDIAQIHAIFDELSNENGEIRTTTNDYAIRQGVTTRPITTNPVRSVQVITLSVD